MSLHFNSNSLRNSGNQNQVHDDFMIENDHEVQNNQHDYVLMEDRPEHINGHQLPTAPNQIQNNGNQQIAQPSIHARRFSAVLVGVGAALRALLAVGTLGLSEGIKALAEGIYNAATTKPRPQGQITLNMPGTNQQVQVDASILPTRVPKNMSNVQLQQALQQKLDDGYQLVHDINNGNVPGRNCTVKDSTDIMFFLQAKAETTNNRGSFVDGAFTIADPGNRIKTFLDSCTESYQRDSSHITAFQSNPGCGHRGIDANGGGNNFDNTLPHNMKTLLYGRIPQGNPPSMPSERLYLKIESHGAWLTRPRGGDEATGPHRTGNHHDVGAFLGHSLSFIATRGQGSAAGSFKERIPNTVSNDYKNILAMATGQVKTILESNEPLSTAGGIRIMLANVNDVLQNHNVPFALETALRNFDQTLRQGTMDNLDLRFGNEVIFNQADIN